MCWIWGEGASPVLFAIFCHLCICRNPSPSGIFHFTDLLQYNHRIIIPGRELSANPFWFHTGIVKFIALPFPFSSERKIWPFTWWLCRDGKEIYKKAKCTSELFSRSLMPRPRWSDFSMRSGVSPTLIRWAFLSKTHRFENVLESGSKGTHTLAKCRRSKTVELFVACAYSSTYVTTCNSIVFELFSVDSRKCIKTVVWTRTVRRDFDDKENAYFWKRFSVDRV